MQPFLARLAACALSGWAVYQIVGQYFSTKILFTFLTDWSIPGMAGCAAVLYFLYVLFGKGK